MKGLQILMVAIFALTALGAPAAGLLDMHGRRVEVPRRVQRVVGAEPPVTYLLYSIDPGLLAALNAQPDEGLRRVFRPEVLKKPVIGAFGEGRIGGFNPEVLLDLKPDLVLAWPRPGRQVKVAPLEARLASTGIPTAFLSLDSMDSYPDAYEFLGRLLGRQQRCAQLANCFRAELGRLKAFSAALPRNGRVSVYLAEDRDGLLTASEDSVHSEAIALAGGKNVHRGASANRRGKDRLSIEQVMLYDPDVIVAKDPAFYNAVWRDSRWAGIKAVRKGRVYLAPRVPFSWLDQPPSFMRLLGAKWLAQSLYPERFKADLMGETRDFFRLFFGIHMGDRELRELLAP